jgi:hypothetical protein
MLGLWEHSTDAGKTWSGCGVLVEGDDT